MRGRRNVLTDDGGEEFEYREYVPADIADKLLTALVKAYTDLLNYSYAAGGDTLATCDVAIQDATKE
jgi:hypothetical protein